MSSQSSIEWTEKTWNPLVGCTRVSAGCQHCYAETMSNRLAGMARADMNAGKNPGCKTHYLNVLDKHGRWNGTVNLVGDALTDPLHWKKPRRVFVNSMSDLFHEMVPFEFIDKVFAVMALCPQHTFQVLTKRPKRMAEYTTDKGLGHRLYQQVSRWLDEGDDGFLGRAWNRVHSLAGESCSGSIYDFTAWNLPLTNAWLGASVEDQATADERIPHLLRCPAAVRWLSCEPLLGPVFLGKAGAFELYRPGYSDNEAVNLSEDFPPLQARHGCRQGKRLRPDD